MGSLADPCMLHGSIPTDYRTEQICAGTFCCIIIDFILAIHLLENGEEKWSFYEVGLSMIYFLGALVGLLDWLFATSVQGTPEEDTGDDADLVNPYLAGRKNFSEHPEKWSKLSGQWSEIKSR